jgi:hypothetical protein
LKLDGKKPTHAAVLRRAKAIGPEGRGLHDGIFERNAECAELGSGLIDQSQKRKLAANSMADRKV